MANTFGPIVIVLMAVIVVIIVSGVANSGRRKSDDRGPLPPVPPASDERAWPMARVNMSDRSHGSPGAEANAEKWFCPTANCRAENPAYARFCRRCGRERA